MLDEDGAFFLKDESRHLEHRGIPRPPKRLHQVGITKSMPNQSYFQELSQKIGVIWTQCNSNVHPTEQSLAKLCVSMLPTTAFLGGCTVYYV